MNIEIRKGTPADIPHLLGCIQELAEYEKAAEQVAVTEEELMRDGFGSTPLFDFLVAVGNGKIMGIALYYYKYSTWKGKTMFLEDLIVKEQYRKHGLGRKLFVEVCKIAHNQKCRRMDWQVLDWNTPAIAFYKKFGAILDPEWLDGRLFEHDLHRIASTDKA